MHGPHPQPAAPAGSGRVGRRVEALVARAVAARAGARVLWISDDLPVASLERDAADVVVSLGALSVAADPVTVLDELARVAAHDLVLAEPRAPFHLLTRDGRGRRAWRSPQLVRLACRVAALRDVDRPWPWTVLWLVKY